MMDAKLAYWIGLVQADGNTRLNKENKIRAIEFTNKNIKLIEKFCEVCEMLFGIYPKINKRRTNSSYYSGVYAIVNKLDLLESVEFRDPPRPPDFLSSNIIVGAYLAGVIDGDGDIRIKRKAYPQCVIRISSSLPQSDLKNFIEKSLNCKVSIRENKEFKDGNKLWKKWYTLEFCVSSKNSDFIKNYILPYLVSEHKIEKLKSYRSAPAL